MVKSNTLAVSDADLNVLINTVIIKNPELKESLESRLIGLESEGTAKADQI